MICELRCRKSRIDAAVVHGRILCEGPRSLLTRDELRYILDPDDVMGADYPSETFRVLKNNETRAYGEYRTRRLVLAAWDQLTG